MRRLPIGERRICPGYLALLDTPRQSPRRAKSALWSKLKKKFFIFTRPAANLYNAIWYFD